MRIQVLFCVLAMALVPSVWSAQVLLVNFDGPPQANITVYAPGPGDIIPPGTTLMAGPGVDPHLGSYPGSPDTDTPGNLGIPQGFQGGNVLVTTNSSSASGVPPSGEGLYLALDPYHAGSFTAEALVYVTTLTPAGAEYFLQDIFGCDNLTNSGTIQQWVIRLLGSQLFGDELQCMTKQGAVNPEQNATDTVAFPHAGSWVHVAVVYDEPLNSVSLYRNGNPVPVATTAPNFTSSAAGELRMDDMCIGYYPNGAGSNRTTEGYIDAVSLDNTALAPANFWLPVVGVTDWSLY